MADEFDKAFGPSKNEQYWKKRLANQGSISNPAPRSMWRRFMDSLDDTIRHYSPAAAGARAVQKTIPLDRDYGVDQKKRRQKITQEEKDWREVRSNFDPADSVADVVADFAGGMAGSLISDPTTYIAPGRTLGGKIIGAGVAGAGSDAALQGVEIAEGVRDKYDPIQGGMNAAFGPALVGIGHGVGKYRVGRSIRRGASDPEFGSLHKTIVSLEGGGTLKNPKTSPKGAMGVMQVMPETARDPGFGIRPWNGKTQEDLARVGRQYLAVMNDRYGGDKAKVMAAYNAGPGRVDAAIARHGEDWLRHMPHETLAYVEKGLGKLDRRVAAKEKGQRMAQMNSDELEAQFLQDQVELNGVSNEIRNIIAKADDTNTPFDAFNTDPLDDGLPQFRDKGAGDLHSELKAQLENDADLPEWRRKEIEQALKDLENWDSQYGDMTPDEMPTYKEGQEFDDGHNYHDDSDLSNSLIQIEDDDEFLNAYLEATSKNPRWMSGDAIQERIDNIIDRKATLSEKFPEPYDLSLRGPRSPDHLDSKTMQDAARSMQKFDRNIPEDIRNEPKTPEELFAAQRSSIEEPKNPELIRQARKSQELRNKFNNADAEGAYNSLDSRVPSKDKRAARAPGELRPADSYSPEEWFKMSNPQKLEAIDSQNRLEAIRQGSKNTLGGLIEHPFYGPASRASFSGDDFHRVGWAWDEDGRAFRWVEKSNDGGKTWRVERSAGAQKEPGKFPNKNPVVDAGFDSPKPPKWQEIKTAINKALEKFGELWTNEEGSFRPFKGDYTKRYDRAWLYDSRADAEKHLGVGDTVKYDSTDHMYYIHNEKQDAFRANPPRNILKDDSGAFRPFGRDPAAARDPNDPEQKLIDAIKRAKPISAEQRKLHHQARSDRASHVGAIQGEQQGLAGYKRQMAALKGALPKAEYESIADQFDEADVNHLLNKITNSKSLLSLEKVSAQTALMKLLGGDGMEVPTAGDIKLLSQVMSEDFIRTLLDNRPFMQKFWHGVKNALNLPRALMSSFDLSAPLRQGIFMIGRKEYWKSFANMFKLFGSENASKALMNNIHSRSTWKLMKQSGLAITDPHGHFLADREEDFMTDWAEKIPLIGEGVKASNRAYSGFLNKLRADVFDSFVEQYHNAGINLATDPAKLKEIASFINASTGRGNLGKWGNQAAPALNAVFFSPRLIASRLQLLANPGTYIRKDPILRKAAIKGLLSYGAATTTVAGLAKYGLGMDVEDDTLSSDFMKPKIGNTRFDIMGGFQQYIRLASQLIQGKTETGKGEEKDLGDPKEYKADTRRDILIRFGINKLSPIGSLISNILEGKDPTGKPVNVKDEVVQRFIPMFIQDVADVIRDDHKIASMFSDPEQALKDLGAAVKDNGAKAAAFAVPSVFGVGLQTYAPREGKKDEDEFDKAFSTPTTDEFDKAFGGKS